MSLELLGRIQQELSITGSAVYETVLALAERANRKVQVLRLHSQASSLLSQLNRDMATSDVKFLRFVQSARRSAMSQLRTPVNWKTCSVTQATTFSI